MSRRVSGLVALLSLLVASSATADPIFSQIPPSNANGYASDRDFDFGGLQEADDFTLAAPATARSVVWRGAYASSDTPAFPLSFDLIFYGDSGGLPNANNVLSATTVSFPSPASITDTGIDAFGLDVYEFRANLTPAALDAATTYWFSALADTENDADDNWTWTSSAGGINGAPSASRTNLNNNNLFSQDNLGDFYFVLDDELIVPEPASLALAGLALATLAVVVRADATKARII